MADRKKIVNENVDGDFFVDTSCIDCDTCRQLAPESFKDAGEYSYVFQQPRDEEQRRVATQALLACPTGSIGCSTDNIAAQVIDDFPMLLDDNVFYCGFNSPKSYGGNSYFIQDEGGNWLIDSPKYSSHLVRQFEQYGGIKYIFLTHEDDVADADRYAALFEAQRIIHRAALKACRDAEIIVDDRNSFEAGTAFSIIHTPGHTRGHMVLLYKDKFLFTGDHLYYNRGKKHLDAFKDYCWYSWEEQTASMEKLLTANFEWVLPGHGERKKLTAENAKLELTNLIKRMKSDNEV
ncbi:MAG: MBL fold metallo-hydrolase [Candidatus Obscuribacterales bacterium]|nr:MBL fold metallo-hydrolase [Candidatus Obscuribacterales bacterium]